MQDPTENCDKGEWHECQQTRCQYHGTCHKEAMMQPEPNTVEDYSKPPEGTGEVA